MLLRRDKQTVAEPLLGLTPILVGSVPDGTRLFAVGCLATGEDLQHRLRSPERSAPGCATNMTARPRRRSRVACPAASVAPRSRASADVVTVTPSILVANPWTRLPTNPWTCLPPPDHPPVPRSPSSRLAFSSSRGKTRGKRVPRSASSVKASATQPVRSGRQRLRAAIAWPWTADQAITTLIIAGLVIPLACIVVGIIAIINLA